MKKVIKGTGGYVNLWAQNQKISGLTFVNPNISSLKCGRDMEPEAINICTDIMQKTHQNFAVQERGLILLESHPFIGVVQMLLLVVHTARTSVLKLNALIL